MNLLAETLECIAESGHTPADIVYIGNRDGYSCTWEQFQTLADIEYDEGFGAAEVASDLHVVFKDGQQLFRAEYDGSEWWEFSRPFQIPEQQQPITCLVGGLWPTLGELNGEDRVNYKVRYRG